MADPRTDKAAPEAESLPLTPDKSIDETIPGGAYMRNTKIVKGKHMGGQVVNANGKVLKSFKDNEVNTGAKGLTGREIGDEETPEFQRDLDDIKGRK